MAQVAVRNGQLVEPECWHCGCRLAEILPYYYMHFRTFFTAIQSYGNVDSAGCKCPYLDSIWVYDDKAV